MLLFCSVLFFFFPLVCRQHNYLTYVSKRLVNKESIGIFNIYDVIVWFLDKNSVVYLVTLKEKTDDFLISFPQQKN